MSVFAERFKQSFDRRLPHFSTAIPYIVATVLIMMVPLSVVLSQQRTSLQSEAAAEFVTVTVENEVTGQVIPGAFVSINSINDEYICKKTNQEGLCVLAVPSDAGPYSVYAIRDEYVPESQTFPELLNGIYITLKLTPEDADSPQPDQDPSKSSQGEKMPNDQYENSNDPNTGSPPDDSGTQTPGPEDFGCLGSCATPTPNYCITPAPSEEGSPEETGTPNPTDGLYESIIERVQRQITETWNRVLSGLGDRNPNLKPPDFSN